MNIKEATQQAIESHQAGNLQKAENIYKEILSAQPNNFYALHYLGALYCQLGNYDLAIAYIEKALQIDSSDPHACYNLGIAFQGKGRLDEAISSYQKALRLNPENTDAYVNLGIVYKETGQLDEAITCYRKALRINSSLIAAQYNLGYALQMKGNFDKAVACYQYTLQLNPNIAAAYYNLGYIYQKKGLLDEAKIHFEKALQLNPSFADAYNGLGNVFYEKGQLDEAIACFEKALQLNPNFADAYNNLGSVFQEKEQLDDAISYYKKAIQINPNHPEAYNNLGSAFYIHGNQNEALSSFETAMFYDPTNVKARWAKCMAQLPIIYQDPSDIEISRHRYREALMKLNESISCYIPKDIEATAEAIGSMQPFFLACQGLNNLEPQRIYGELVHKIMALQYPRFAERLSIPYLSPENPLRIGIVSRFFYWHSVWKIPLRGWIENLEKKRFSIYGYHTGKIKDYVTETAREYCHRFVEDIHSFENLCQIIRNDTLHILIYPEIGMDPVSLKLASLRLAPIQCTSLGHPDTSGLPTIDYYLSSELMEPIYGDDHYTEKLIRLPNLGFFYTPLEVPSAEIRRMDLGLRPQSVIYLCSHALFTHLPQYDEIYPRIATEAGDCQFVFISHKSTLITEQFRLRINKAFHRYGLNANDYVIILPRLDQKRYHALNCLSDIFLDTIGWSANNSSFEAIACNLPIVTLPGDLMRQRHCSGILTMMELTETIASSLEHYIALAVKIGKDTEFRRNISKKIASNKHLIYRDRTCIIALEDFIERIVRECV